jgi:hypothetical protein
MDRYEYMRIPVHQIPEAIFEIYNLKDLVHNGFVYVEIRKGMYGLPQAGILAHKQLLPILESNGYKPSPTTPGLFKHETRQIAFALIVDDFGVKYVGIEEAKHLQQILGEKYTITTDWEGETFLGMKLKWDYEARTVDISMPGYIEKALQRFQHSPPRRPEHSPHAYIEPNYGAPVQYTAPIDDSPPLNKIETKQLREIIGTLLYYGRAVDNTMLVALGSLAAAQEQGTQQTAKASTKLLNYAATHPDATVRFKASAMILHIHSDASYLSEPKARSRVGGYFYLGNGTHNPPINGAIHVVSQIMTNVMASAAEAEVGGLFINGQTACPIRSALEFLGHPQPATIIITDNECAKGIANDTVKQKRSKAIDMRFYWIRDRVAQKQFEVLWRKGSENLADYFTKHHPASHHQKVRSRYLQQQDAALMAQDAALMAQDAARMATEHKTKFTATTKIQPVSTLRKHKLNQTRHRSTNHTRKLQDAQQRGNEYDRNNQPWTVVNRNKHSSNDRDEFDGNAANKIKFTDSTKYWEGVLNNDYSHQYSIPLMPSEPYLPCAQANDTSPCSQARLIGGANNDRYWLNRLVQKPPHIRQ